MDIIKFGHLILGLTLFRYLEFWIDEFQTYCAWNFKQYQIMRIKSGYLEALVQI